jgi:hypothetical protein
MGGTKKKTPQELNTPGNLFCDLRFDPRHFSEVRGIDARHERGRPAAATDSGDSSISGVQILVAHESLFTCTTAS